ncbi:MAG: MBL fold metallo-hydrolase [Chitinophagaceae bacterium]|nr:MAG: MBL fold metallo-hydrolase [Chitinophagaceae bacterium]
MKKTGFVFSLCLLAYAAQSRSANPGLVSLPAKYMVPKNLEIPQKGVDSFTIRMSGIGGSVFFLECVNGFGGGNVAASVGEDGILLVDDMFAMMGNKIKTTLATLSPKPIRMVLNTHFHGDHIQGNKVFGESAVIVAQENVRKRLQKSITPKNPSTQMLPVVVFRDSMSLHFNGEEIKLVHFPNSHTDGDAMIYFTGSKVIHLGDMFFFGMFPAVYTEGGGNIKQLISSLEQILTDVPADVRVIPGHGGVATMKDLQDYVTMLKETTGIVETAIRKGVNLEQMKQEKLLQKYNALGDGGAQSTDQYLAMLYKLLLPVKK